MTNTDLDGNSDGGLVDRVVDDEAPVGDTPEAHDELSVHDLPPGHPMRDELARRTGQDDTPTAEAD